jgi:hypothetical protein
VVVAALWPPLQAVTRSNVNRLNVIRWREIIISLWLS